jgi:hypothetical protein
LFKLDLEKNFKKRKITWENVAKESPGEFSYYYMRFVEPKADQAEMMLRMDRLYNDWLWRPGLAGFTS